MIPDARHPRLDATITLKELNYALRKCKNDKSPGPDGINFEFYKNLTNSWKLYLVEFFNKVIFNHDLQKKRGSLRPS